MSVLAPSLIRPPGPLTAPPYEYALLRLKTRVPLLTTLPLFANAPVVPPVADFQHAARNRCRSAVGIRSREREGIGSELSQSASTTDRPAVRVSVAAVEHERRC